MEGANDSKAVTSSRMYFRWFIPESNPYAFALVFNNEPVNNDSKMYFGMVNTLKRLARAGISFDVLNRERSASRQIIVMVKVDNSLISDMAQALQLERWISSGCEGVFDFSSKPDIGDLTYADRVQAGMLLLEKAGVQHGDGVSVIALPCLKFYRRLLALHRHQTSFRRLWHILLCSRVRNPGSIQELDDPQSYRIGREFFIHEMRRHSGDEIAIQYAFTIHVVRWLCFPSLLGALLQIADTWELLHRITYLRLLGVFGLSISAVFLPLMLKYWQRRCSTLATIWNTTLLMERAYPNIHYDPCGKRGHGEHKQLQEHYLFEENFMENTGFRNKIRQPLSLLPLNTLFIGVQVLLMGFVTTLSTTLYSLTTAVPDCSAKMQVFCLPSSQIIAIRALLAILIGLLMFWMQHYAKICSHHVTDLKNHRLERDRNHTLIVNTFFLQWVSAYLWLLPVAFVVTPFGEELHHIISRHLSGILVYEYNADAFNPNNTLIIPLLVMITATLIFETILPMMKDIAKIAKNGENICSINMQSRRNYWPSEAVLLAIDLSRFILPSDDIMKIGCCQPMGQFTFDDIVAMTKLPYRWSGCDYEDLVIHIGLLGTFSVVSPSIVFLVLLNAWLSTHANLAKRMVHFRRPQPRKARDAGEWEGYLFVTMLLSGTISVALFCFSTGQLEAFFSDCGDDATPFGPNRLCFGRGLMIRLTAALFLEHIVFLIQALLFGFIPSRPSWTIGRQNQIHKLRLKYCIDTLKTKSVAELFSPLSE
uniref:Anoctamin transmembrane domain-containing protein n=1 Tax=Spongospora subterranea TaxID=70186 RepID=A0A0H5RCH1_9EUKA|eukprot:CRZ11950.1 hypothetical protein [Spongospora subterranea]